MIILLTKYCVLLFPVGLSSNIKLTISELIPTGVRCAADPVGDAHG